MKRIAIFDDAVKKLTIEFVAVLMVVALAASATIYRIAERQIDNGLRRQQSELLRRQLPLPLSLIELNEVRDFQAREARSKLIIGLAFFNSMTLVIGTYFSSGLAKRTLKPIEEAMEAQNQFIADASHELRTPITAMKTELEVASRAKNLKTNELKEVLASTLEEVNDLQALSENLLVLAQLPHQRGESNFLQLNLTKLLQEATDKLRPLAKTKKIKLLFNSKNLPSVVVYGDFASLQRALVIILDNAIKYSQPSSSVRLLAQTSSDRLNISVIDTGIGISSSDKKHIFNRFYRSDKARSTSSGGGYGLGLPIAKSIVEHHGGELKFTSQPNTETVFTISLPVKKRS